MKEHTAISLACALLLCHPLEEDHAYGDICFYIACDIITQYIACDIIIELRVVLDTDVMVAALRSPTGASRWLLKAALVNRIATVVSVPLILEYEAVLTRPEHLAISRLTDTEVIKIIDAIATVSIHARLSFRWRPLLSDANDDMVLETAINGGAGLLVTFNIRDFGAVGEPFGCRAVLPREAKALV